MRVATRIALFVLVAISCSTPPAYPNSQQPKIYEKSYALVVGISAYRNKDKRDKDLSPPWPFLKNARSDAEAVAKFLKGSGFEVTPLYDEQATYDAIHDAFEEIAGKVEQNDAVLFYFAGHGDTKQIGGLARGYIIPWDATHNDHDFIRMENLKMYSSDMGHAKHQVFILDSCYGGILARDQSDASERGVSLPPKDPNPTLNDLQELGQKTAREVLTAGRRDQSVLDGGSVYGDEHSLFTGVLLAALNGKAGKGHYITFNQLFNYVHDHALTSTQEPNWDTLAGHDYHRQFIFTVPNSAIRVAISDFVADPSVGQSLNLADERTLVEQIRNLRESGLELLLLELQDKKNELGLRYAEFERETKQVLQTRGDSKLTTTGEQSQQQSDYTLRLRYLQLDRNRIRITPTFSQDHDKLRPITVQPVEVNVASLNFKPFAVAILRGLAPDADFHLHLELGQCPSCYADMRGAIENWASNLPPTRIKYVKDPEENSPTDIIMRVVPHVLNEGDHEVFSVQIQFIYREAEPETFSARGEVHAWRDILKNAEGKAQAYLDKLARENP